MYPLSFFYSSSKKSVIISPPPVPVELNGAVSFWVGKKFYFSNMGCVEKKKKKTTHHCPGQPWLHKICTAPFHHQDSVLFTLIYISSEISMAACPEALFLIVGHPAAPDPSWRFSENFLPLLACRAGQQIDSSDRSSAKAELNQRPRNSTLTAPFQGDSWSAGMGPLRSRGDLGAGPWASLAAWPAVSPVDKRTGEGKQRPVLSPTSLSGCASGRIRNSSKEGKGLGLKFRRTDFSSSF